LLADFLQRHGAQPEHRGIDAGLPQSKTPAKPNQRRK
jgi:hypothetical protein